MHAIAAFYGSDSSDADDASGAELESAQNRGNLAATGADGGGSSSDSESDAEDSASSAPPSRKRHRGAEDSPPKWKRAFAHVDGNWPSHVKVEIAPTDEVMKLVDGVVGKAQNAIGDAVTLVPMAGPSDDEQPDLHLSLSRPFVLTYDQIEMFVDALRVALKWRSRFQVTFAHAIVLINDDATRSFLALQVGTGADQVVNLLKCVDKCMREFGLPTYYENPIPHVSIASALGDSLRSALSQTQLEQAEATSLSVVVRVASVRVVIGNKHFHIPLR